MSKVSEAFDGDTYDAKRDHSRLKMQLDEVRSFMLRNAGWRSLDEIATATSNPTASVSARLRDLRKSKYGSYKVDRRLRKGTKGIYEYRIDFGGIPQSKGPSLAVALLAGGLVCALYSGFMLSPAFGRDYGQWENSDPVISEWYRGLMQPDNPTVSCCGKADAYWADSFYVDKKTGETIAIITDDRDDAPLGRPHVPKGTRIVVPNNKLKWDRGNPTGHGVIFLTSGGIVLCFVQPTGT